MVEDCTARALMMHRITDINLLLCSKQLTFLQIMLFSTMQLVINQMKELEHREKYVEKVKEEAANGELEMLAKVEEMKQTIANAKEANDMVESCLDSIGTV